MVDAWLLEYLAKVSAVGSVLIVLYVFGITLWRISQMPNNQWNWNDWQWPLVRQAAVEIYRKPTEMPFTLSLVDRCREDLNKITYTLTYLKRMPPPVVTVMWGPSASYLMKTIHSPWIELNDKLMLNELENGQWNSMVSSDFQSVDVLDYYMIHRMEIREEDVETTIIESVEAECYETVRLVISPPTEFDWSLLKNQYRYPAAVFVTSCGNLVPPDDGIYAINGLVQIVHVKNELFPKASSTLAQYIKMSNSQCHLLQSLYVMDDHRIEDEDDANNAEEVEEPFKDILCSVCQVLPVTRVIIPCRHVCLCTQCFEKVEICPICRGTIMFYFKTRTETDARASMQEGLTGESENLTGWQRFQRWNDRFTNAIGLIRI